MTPVQASAAKKDEGKCQGIWNGPGRRLGEDWREGDVKRAEAGWSPQHPLVSAAINAQSCARVLSLSFWLWGPAIGVPPSSLLGTGPASELNMAELVGHPMLGGGGCCRDRAVNRVLSVQPPFLTRTLLCSPGFHVQSSGTEQCPGGQLASRVCLNDLMENMEGAGTRTVLSCDSECG